MRFLPCPTRTSDSCTLTGSCLEPVCGATPPAGRSPPLRPELHSNQNSDTLFNLQQLIDQLSTGLMTD